MNPQPNRKANAGTRPAGGPWRNRAPGWLIFLPAALALALAATGCQAPQPDVKIPARILYLEGQMQEDQELYSEATTKLKTVVEQNAGSRLGNFANLKMGLIELKKEEWVTAESYFRLFLSGNANSHLTPFVLFQIMKAHHENSYTGLFVRNREIDRDMEPNRQLIREFKRFYFLFPNSMYSQQVREYFRAARESIAEHERLVADYYYDRGLYNAAASRYLYLLRNYPFYQDSEYALEMLIRSYRQNVQPAAAEEMERIYQRIYKNGSAQTPPQGEKKGEKPPPMMVSGVDLEGKERSFKGE
ncbi:MAG: outer membrane protein assembly factor BamD [Deltaproteobacteria bacterium]|nr:outer membrane protein assembly factor BamD [Deltaproteobacteria bacterium]